MRRLFHIGNSTIYLLTAALTGGLLLLASCRKEKQFPDEPVISFIEFIQVKDAAGKDSAGVLRLRFTDGDGDIGLTEKDTFPPFNKGSLYYYNFFISYFEKQNGTFVKVVVPPVVPGADTLTGNGRIPYIPAIGQDKALEGEIRMELFTNNPFSSYDTIRYEVSICDRALNRSNMVTTPEIILVK